MPAPKGHPIWGNPKNIKIYTPDEFAEKFIEYIEWADNNPWLKTDFVKSGEMAGQKVYLETARAYSIEEFCNYAQITMQTFYNYSKAVGYETYFDICTRIKQIIDAQHFSGGMSGVFNSNLAARKLGLGEKSDVTSNGETINQPKVLELVITKMDTQNPK